MAIKRKRGRPSVTSKINREELLKSALKAFAHHGFEGTNVKQLGREAGIAPSLFYYHFKDKLGLWKEALKLEAKQLERAMELESFDDSSVNQLYILKHWIRAFIHFSANHPEFHQVIAFEMAHQSKRADWLLEHILRPLQADIEKRINILQTAGLIKKIPMANFTSITVGAANVFFTQGYQMQKLYGVDVFEEEEVNRHAEAVIELFLNGILVKNHPASS
jgi:AcrR family transcriptional regulator